MGARGILDAGPHRPPEQAPAEAAGGLSDRAWAEGTPADEPASEHLRPEDLRAGGPVVVQQWRGAPLRSYPRRPPTVLHVLHRAVGRRPVSPAATGLDLTSGDVTTLTTTALADRVTAAAARLRERGVRPGDAVGLCAGNGLDLLVAVLACARASAVAVGLDPRLAPDAHAWSAAHLGVRLCLAGPEQHRLLADAGLDPVALQEVTGPPRASSPRWSLPSGAEDDPRPSESDTYGVVLTSGTTGRPKASAVVHRASVHSGMAYARLLGLGPGDRTAVVFSLTYISALHAHVLPALLSGAELVLLDSPSPRRLVQALREDEIAWAYAVPSVWRLCLRVPEFTAAGLPRLRHLASGGAPFPPALVADLRARLPGTRLMDVYGLTETHSPACVLRDLDVAVHPGSVGRPLDCMEAQVRDADGRALPAGAEGDLHLRGSLVTTGYVGDDEATAAAIDADGWFATGDVARIDEDGFVSIVDRRKDMINRGGTKVFPAEVERVLREHPAVEDAAVVGLPDDLGGESVAAVVVLTPGREAPVAELRGWVRDHLAEHAAPRLLELAEELPRNRVGKVDKPLLRERLAGGTGSGG